MTANTERQAAFKRRQKELGLVQCNVWVNARQFSDFVKIAQMLRDNPDLEIGPLRNTATGRLVKVK